eukprot:CAMPEP_0119139144 /NCGR_PEP_ID=MMETSP1310-20130426/26961_1 /TAXON_ID=464262 /ORGANISM="Genus nov. species nov., Strain RCC2339" /LENGTH=277 /DNA_ID=CAMNT_0007130407 /DNA_START=117 /DNA_END=947 /DNA_ORIENTATION=-
MGFVDDDEPLIQSGGGYLEDIPYGEEGEETASRAKLSCRDLAKRHWVDYLVLCVVFILVGILAEFVEPFHRHLPMVPPSCGEGNKGTCPELEQYNVTTPFPMTSYPHADKILVPWYILFTTCLAFPHIFFGIGAFFMRSAHDLHHASMGLFSAFAYTLVFTEAIKNQAGRYRPDFFYRLLSGDEDMIKDGRYSFPSGHSSLSFATMAFLSCYIAGKLGTFRSDAAGQLWQFSMICIPIQIAWFIAVSRTQDYHHNFSDIATGAMLGFPIGVITYHLW